MRFRLVPGVRHPHITGAIVGVGASRRLSAVRRRVAGRAVWAWVLTIPGAFAIAWVSEAVVRSAT